LQVQEALAKLEHALELRQRELGVAASYTERVNAYTAHPSRDGTLVQHLDQRDAIPSVLWAWSEHGPEPAREGLALAQEAVNFATRDLARGALYASEEFKADDELFAWGGMDVPRD